MRLRNLLLGTAMVVAGVVPAAANTIAPDGVSVTDLGGGLYQWSYDAYLSTGRLVDADEFFTLYDIRGYQPGSLSYTSATGSAWSGSESLTGLTPADVMPADNPSLMNLTFKFNGPSPLTADFSDPPAFLGTFSFISTISGINPNGVWVSRDLTPTGSGFQTGTRPAAVPLPDGGWTVAMLGSALLTIGLLRRRFGVR